jgi:hypothetical protein
VNFLGYHADAGLGGLLTGDAAHGGLSASAGTPFGNKVKPLLRLSIYVNRFSRFISKVNGLALVSVELSTAVSVDAKVV